MKNIFILLLLFVSLKSYSQTLEKDTFQIKEIEVSSTLPYHATNSVPITFKNLSQQEISNWNYGQEPSLLLNNTPSVTTYSDAGNWGYSYIRLRGIDQTRINMTLNGIPLNEPEDQGCYFSNYPDFLESVKMVQIQRGVGMTKDGISNFAGSLNFENIDYENFLDFNAGFGSFDSRKFSLGFGTDGLYIRASSINTDGYKNHSGNKSKSIFISTYNKFGKNIIRFIGFTGSQKNELAWLGSTENEIKLNPKYNSCTNNENDNFNQNRLQLHHSLSLNSKSSINTTIYYNYLKGWYTYQYYYDEQTESYPHTSIDNFGSIDKYNLKSNTFGLSSNYIYRYKNLDIYTGLNAQFYNRKHNGQTWLDVNNKDFDSEYFNTGYRNEISSFLKLQYKIGSFNIFQDYQYRWSTFEYVGDVKIKNFKWNFFNPTIGIEKEANNIIYYYSIGTTHREPTRNDIFMGMDNLWDNTAYVDMKPESVIDNELGFRFNKNNFSLNTNLYHMSFRNEITLNGYFGPTGILLHSNVDKSFRSGLEIEARYKLNKIEFNNNSSFSYNKIKVENKRINPILTPNVIINQDFVYKLGRYSFLLNARYQGSSFIDLANENKLEGYFCLNGNLKIRISKLEVSLFVNNLLNNKFYTNGILSSDGPLYFISPSRNYFLNFKLKI